jgi:hypothetical protein
MSRDDAITIVSMIVNGWPGPAWDADRLEAYVQAIMGLPADVTTRAVARAQKKLEFRPSVAALMEYVQIERRLSEREVAEFVVPEKIPKPTWVERWERARAVGDQRPFPEQIPGMDALARISPENYAAYAPPEVPISDREVWVQGDEYL